MPNTKYIPKKINIVTLGCSKNTADSEVLAAQIENNNIDVVHNSEYATDTVIINTCGFINDAKEESIETILHYANAKKVGLVKKIIVMGCLSQRYKDDLKKNIPEIDHIFGIDEYENIVNSLNGKFDAHKLHERLLSTPNHYAYLKIADGCDRNCSFCAIPYIKGKYNSKPLPQIIDEAKLLADKGAKELLLVAQDLTYYGLDIYKKRQLNKVIEELLKIKTIEWLRLHYLYPTHFPMEIIDLMKENEKICNYIDIPVQHISDRILTSMKRNHTGDDVRKLIEQFRNAIPDVTLRTTIIVGYPGETEKDFEELKHFIEQTKFDRLGVFTYSNEENTDAYSLKDNIPFKTKKDRADELMQLQENISYELNYNKLGTTIQAIVDRKEGQYYIARSQADSPEVDNEILISTDKEIKIGEFYTVKVTGVESFDLFAEII